MTTLCITRQLSRLAHLEASEDNLSAANPLLLHSTKYIVSVRTSHIIMKIESKIDVPQLDSANHSPWLLSLRAAAFISDSIDHIQGDLTIPVDPVALTVHNKKRTISLAKSFWHNYPRPDHSETRGVRGKGARAAGLLTHRRKLYGWTRKEGRHR